VLSKIRAGERKALVEGKVDWPGPEGKRFKDLVGDSREARKLFALMTEDDRRADLAEKAGADPAGAHRLYAAEVGRLADFEKKAMAGFQGQVMSKDGMDRMRDASRKAVGAGDVALILYLGAFPSPAGAADSAEVNPVLRAGFIDLVIGPFRAPARTLFAAWLDRRTDPAAVQGGLMQALYVDIKEAVPAARKFAADPKAAGRVAGTAALVLGNLGAKDDLAVLSRLREDTRPYQTYRTVKGQVSDIQVRDVAAAMSLVLRGRDIG
jgi:hypothetical protein